MEECKMDSKKRLVSLVSTEGKTVEQISEEAKKAFEKFKKAVAEAEKTKKEYKSGDK